MCLHTCWSFFFTSNKKQNLYFHFQFYFSPVGKILRKSWLIIKLLKQSQLTTNCGGVGGKNPQTFICLVKTPTSFCFNKKQADKVNSIQSIQRLWLIFSRHIRFGKLGVTTIWLNERKKYIYTHQIQTHKNKFKVILLDFLLSFQLCLADFLQLMTAQSQKPLFKLILRCSTKCNWKLKKNNLVNGPWDKITFQTTLFFF